jgi:hypothetical protein
MVCHFVLWLATTLGRKSNKERYSGLLMLDITVTSYRDTDLRGTGAMLTSDHNNKKATQGLVVVNYCRHGKL